jgi:hypothetical protein
MSKYLTYTLIASLLAIGSFTLRAQSNDALLNKLVEKGILTAKEADEMKKEADNKKIVTTGLNMPDWVTSVKLYGDVRGRMDYIDFENDEKPATKFKNTDRLRYRVRARAGLTASFKDNLELGVRLTTADPTSDSSHGGNALSGNSTFQNNGSKKFAYIDLAYGKWTPIKNDNWTLSTTIGKMENPFTFSDLVIDNDYTPEGAAIQLAYKLNDMHSFKLTAGGFIIDEVNQGNSASSDPTLIGVQLRWDAKWTKQLESSLGLAALSLSDTENLTNGSIPDINVGNSRSTRTNLSNGGSAGGLTGLLINNYNPLIADGSLTYWIDETPIYKGRFPIRAFGTFVLNPSAPDDNIGWEAGLALGKAGKKGTWELSYRYRYLQADAMFEELVDDDFGAFYAAKSVLRGSGGGYGAGTNVKGHTVKASYSPYDALTFSITYFRAELINQDGFATPLPKNTDSDTGRLFVDATWKF